MKYGVLVLVLAASLSGCGLGGTEVHREDREFVVTNIKPPKRMYISLKDARNGAHYNDISVGKRCSGWESLHQGSVWTLPEVTYQHGDGSRSKRVDISALKSKIC